MNCDKTILLVDDDEDDRELLTSAVRQVDERVQIVVAENGVKAISCLTKLKETTQLPGLIVLDLNMPFLDGQETYQKIKSELQLEQVPIIIFTSSNKPQDKELFRQLGVEFITKPERFDYLTQIASHMLEVCRSAV